MDSTRSRNVWQPGKVVFPDIDRSLFDEILRGLTTLNDSNPGALVTIDIGSTSKLVRQRARVIVRIAGTKERPFRILRWDWASG